MNQPPNWALSPEDKTRYQNIFAKLPKDAENQVSGADCRDTMMKSQLNLPDLKKVWTLADQNGSGKLDQKQFYICMHLIYVALAGHPIPNAVPTEMINSLNPSQLTSNVSNLVDPWANNNGSAAQPSLPPPANNMPPARPGRPQLPSSMQSGSAPPSRPAPPSVPPQPNMSNMSNLQQVEHQSEKFGCRRKSFYGRVQKNIFLSQKKKFLRISFFEPRSIGNLDPEVDEKLIYDTFSAFGAILKPPHIQRDLETKKSKGYAFVEFDSFDAADAAIEAMNGQYLMNRAISINYAFKKGSKTNERHGTAAERLLASQNPSLTLTQKPNMMFSDNKKDSELSQTVPSAIQQAMPPSLAGAPRFGAPNALHKRAESANTMIPTMNRPPPPGGYPAGFGGMRAPMRAPPPGHFSMTGNYRPQQFATPNPSIMKDGLPSYGNLGVGMKPMHSARYNSPLMAGIQFSGTIHKNGSAFSHLSAVQNQEANLHMTGNMQVFNNPKAPHL